MIPSDLKEFYLNSLLMFLNISTLSKVFTITQFFSDENFLKISILGMTTYNSSVGKRKKSRYDQESPFKRQGSTIKPGENFFSFSPSKIKNVDDESLAEYEPVQTNEPQEIHTINGGRSRSIKDRRKMYQTQSKGKIY